MKKYVGLLIGIMIFVLLLGGAGFLYNRLAKDYEPESNFGTEEENGAEALQDAPDFTVQDKEGNSVSLSDFKGMPIVINFWASWCGPCQSEMPDFQDAYEKYGGEVTFMMVNMTDGIQETKAGAALFIMGQGFTFPVYFDEEQNAASVYSVYSLPTTYFINAEGKLVAGAKGMIDSEILERGISMIYND